MIDMKEIEWELNWSSDPMNPKEEYWGVIGNLNYIIEYDQNYFNYHIYFDELGDCCCFEKICTLKSELDKVKNLVKLHANLYLEKEGYI